MTEKWTNAFGEVPERFEQRVRLTVARMETSEDSARRPAGKLRVIVICAIIATLLLGTALALSSMGVLNTLNENLRGFLQPGAEELVQTGIPQTAQQPRHAVFTLEEAVNDGHQLYLTVRVHGDKDVLLMDANAEPAMATAYWRGEEGQTFSGLAAATGRTLIAAGCDAVDASGAFLSTSAPEIAYDDEDILYTLSCPADSPDVRLRLTTCDLYGTAETSRPDVGLLTATVPVTDARRFAATDLPVTIPTPYGDLLLTDFRMEQTPIATYLRFVFGAADSTDEALAVRLADGIWPQWVDDTGEPYPEGENGGTLTEDEAGNTCCTVVYPASSQLPDSITVRFHSGIWRGEDGVVTLPLHPTDSKEE